MMLVLDNLRRRPSKVIQYARPLRACSTDYYGLFNLQLLYLTAIPPSYSTTGYTALS